MLDLSYCFLSGLLAEAYVKHDLIFFDLPSVSLEQMNGDRLELFRCFAENRGAESLHTATKLQGWDLESTILVLDYSFNDKDLVEYSHGDEEINHRLSQLAVLISCPTMPFLGKELMEKRDIAINIFGKEMKYGDSLLMNIMMDVMDAWNLATLLQTIKDNGVSAEDAFLYGVLSARCFHNEWSKIVWNKRYRKFGDYQVEWMMDYVNPERLSKDVYADDICNNTVIPAEDEGFVSAMHRRPYTKVLYKEFPKYGMMKGVYRLDYPVVDWHYEFEQYGKKYRCILIGDENGPRQEPRFNRNV